MNLHFFKIGGRHIVTADGPQKDRMTKRETISKIVALLACDPDPKEQKFFSQVDTSTWPKAKVDYVWKEILAMKNRGEFSQVKK